MTKRDASARPSTGMIAFALIAVLASLLFVRLGFWQLGRHAEVERRNRDRDARVALPPLPTDSLLGAVSGPVEPAGSGSGPAPLEWRQTPLIGRWQYEREVVVRNRTLYGRPGSHVLTPLRIAGDREVFVLRGWLPAPDGMTPDLSRAHAASGLGAEDGRVGLLQGSRTGSGGPELPSGELAGRIPTFAAADVPAMSGGEEGTLPYFAQLLPREGSEPRAGEPIPVPLPDPGNGPHLSYAIQWFSFALIALVGTGALFRRERQRRALASREPSAGRGSR